MGKILKANDNGVPSDSSFVTKTLTLPDVCFFRFQVYIPQATLDTLATHFYNFSAWPFIINDEEGLELYHSGSTWIWSAYGIGNLTGATVVADTWHTIDLEVSGIGGTDLIWKLNGTTILSYSGTGIAGSKPIDFGGKYGGGIPNEYYYIDNVKIGTTSGGVELFSDDFETGTTSAWDSASGNVTVVDAGTEGIPDVTPPPPVYCINAVDDPNTANPTITIGANYVRDSGVYPFESGNIITSDAEAPSVMYVRGANLPPPGQYTLVATFLSPCDAGVIVRRNGLMLMPIRWLNNDTEIDITGAARTSNDSSGPSLIPILADDVLEIILFHDSTAQLNKVCFTQVVAGGSPTTISLLDSGTVVGASSQYDVPSGNLNLHPANWDIECVDMCVTSNGDIYFVQVLAETVSSVRTYHIEMFRWNGSSWNLITADLTGTGPPASLSGGDFPSVSMVTDGTNVYVCYGQEEMSTLIAFGSPRRNTKFHVKKYNPSSGFTELGSGYRAIDPRINFPAFVATENAAARIKIGPDGKVWVGWCEDMDVTNSAYAHPHLAYWSGSSWVDINPPAPPNLGGAASWAVNYVSDTFQVEFDFRHHDGPSNWPCVFYSVYFRDSSGFGVAAPNWIFAEYNGSSWNFILQFYTDDVWQMGATHTWLNGIGWWQQGAYLLDTGNELLLFAVTGYHSSEEDRAICGKLGATGFEDLGFNALGGGGPGYPSYLGDNWLGPANRWVGGWTGYPGIVAAVDSHGNVFCAFCIERSDFGFAEVILLMKDPGTLDGWTIASKHKQPVAEKTGFLISRIFIDNDDNVYFGGSILTDVGGNSIEYSVVIKYTRENYTAYRVTAGGPLWFYRDGQWRQAGADSEHNVYFYREGQWRPVGSDTEHDIHARISDTWEPA